MLSYIWGRHPSQKTELSLLYENRERGGHPLKENMIRVTDMKGNALSPTYKRRARGLVKAGRAIWTGPEESEIRLVDRPEIPEDNIMKDINNAETRLTEVTPEDYSSLGENRVTPELILERMDQVRLDCQHIYEALGMLKDFKINESPEGGLGDAERARAITAIVKCRETTLQKELDLLGKMYDDLMREKYPND